MDVELSDADLVRQIGSGHEGDTESEFCRRMAPRIRLYGLRHLRGPQAAEDQMQQVLVTTLEVGWGRGRGPRRTCSSRVW